MKFGVLDYSAASQPVLTYRAVGTIADPVSTAVMSGTQGSVPTLVPLRIPAGLLSVGSKIVMQLKVRRVGTAQADVLYIRFGRTGGTSDAVMFTSTFPTTTSPMPAVVELDIDVTGDTTYLASWFRAINNVGFAGACNEIVDATMVHSEDLFLAVTYTTAASSADSFQLLEYDVQVYGVTP